MAAVAAAVAALSHEEEFELHVRVCEARDLRNVVKNTLSKLDPFAYIRSSRGEETIRSPACKEGGTEPVFDFKTMIHARLEDNVTVAIVHEGSLISAEQVLGSFIFSARDLANGEVMDQWFALNFEGKTAGEVHLRLQLMHGGARRIEHAGAAAMPPPPAVPAPVHAPAPAAYPPPQPQMAAPQYQPPPQQQPAYGQPQYGQGPPVGYAPQGGMPMQPQGYPMQQQQPMQPQGYPMHQQQPMQPQGYPMQQPMQPQGYPMQQPMQPMMMQQQPMMMQQPQQPMMMMQPQPQMVMMGAAQPPVVMMQGGPGVPMFVPGSSAPVMMPGVVYRQL